MPVNTVDTTKTVLVVFKDSENTPVFSSLVPEKEPLGSVLSLFADTKKIDLEHYEFWDANEFSKPKRKRKPVLRVLTLRHMVGDKGKLVVHFARKSWDDLVLIELKREEDLAEAETHCQLLRYEITKHTIKKMKAQVWIRAYRKRVAAAGMRFTRKRVMWLHTDWSLCELFKQSIRDADQQKRQLTKDLRDAEKNSDAKRARVGSVKLDMCDRAGLYEEFDD